MKNKGFSIVELMIVVAIISILATTGMISLNRRAERNAIIQMKTQIPIFIENVAQRAFERGESYNIGFDFSSETISVTGVDDIDLEGVLDYAIYDGSSFIDSETLTIDTRGGLSTSSSGIYIFNRDGEALFYIELDSTLPTNYIGINTYEPITEGALSVGTLTYGEELAGSAEDVVDKNNWEKK